MHPVMRQLVREHGVMQSVLDGIEREVAIAEAGGPFNADRVLLALQYLRDFPEWYHHPLEEALFARVIARDPDRAEAFTEVWAEHDRIPALSHRLLDGIIDDADADAAGLRHDLTHYVAEQRRHIQRENDEVFPLLLDVLTDEDWEHGASRTADPDAASGVPSVFKPLLDRIRALASVTGG